MTSLQGFFVLHSSHQTVYAEAHADDLPTWKQVHSLQLDKLANEIRSDKKDENILDANTSALAVQRKILPLDSLNLTLENERQQRLLNAIGKQKHPLIICASLLSKAPNLGGVARTAEIFAAHSLVIADMTLINKDSFQATSVGAADWIDIEEVNEAVRLLLLWSIMFEGPSDLLSQSTKICSENTFMKRH